MMIDDKIRTHFSTHHAFGAGGGGDDLDAGQLFSNWMASEPTPPAPPIKSSAFAPPATGLFTSAIEQRFPCSNRRQRQRGGLGKIQRTRFWRQYARPPLVIVRLNLDG